MMDFILGFIAGVGLIISVITLIEGKKISGGITLVLNVFVPVLMFSYLKQNTGDLTNMSFYFHALFIDKLPVPYLLLILYLGLISLIIYNIFKLKFYNNKKKY